MTSLLGLFSCNNQTTEKSVNKKTVDTTQTFSNENQKNFIYINDKSQYDSAFLNGLSKFNEEIKLIENYLAIRQDTFYFPKEIKIKENLVFSGKKNQKSFVLDVVKKNLTTLNYNFRLYDKNGNNLVNIWGNAILSSTFFLDKVIDHDDQTNDKYLSYVYLDKSHNCNFAIRIGEKDYNGNPRAKVTLQCKDLEINEVTLKDNPTLRPIKNAL